MQKSHVFSLSLIGMLLITVLGVGVSPSLVSAQTASTPTTTASNRTITVTGEGIYLVKPDIAYIYPSIQIADPSLINATLRVDKVTNDIMSSMLSLNIPGNDIQVIDYELYNSGEHYTVASTLRIIVRDLTKLKNAIVKVINTEYTQLYSSDFELNDPQVARTLARKSALSDAKVRANELATSMNGSLGQILAIQEGVATQIVPVQYIPFGQGFLGTANLLTSLQVTVDLTVTFEVR